VSILLVRLRLIGDVVFTTPLIRALRRRYTRKEKINKKNIKEIKKKQRK
jgi:ADP-heptose:LPS heptosyltransferase